MKIRQVSLFSFFLVLATCLLTSTLAFAQSFTTGEISGTVTDPTGAVVANAKVTLKSVEKGNTQTTTSNAQGAYHFPLLAPGTYEVSATAAGFKTASESEVVGVGAIALINFKLELGATGTVVEVTAEASLLQTDTSEISTTMNARSVEMLPNPGNDLSFIAQTAPGSTMNTGGGYGNFSSFGISATSNLFTMNGMYDNDPFLNLNNSGATNLLLGNNEVQEATVVSNGYSGEYGGFAGATINYVTKSGSNQWHGNAAYWWNGRTMNANDWFNNNTTPITPRSFDNANQYAASFGGPIVKNKAFFFANYEGLRVLIPTSTTVYLPDPSFQAATLANIGTGDPGYVPGATAFFTTSFNLFNGAPGASRATPVAGSCLSQGLPASFTSSSVCIDSFRSNITNLTHEYLLAGRFDFNLTNNDKLFIRAQEDKGLQATITDPINKLFNTQSDQPEYQSQASWSHTFGPKAVNNFVGSITYYSAIFQNASTSAALAAYPTTLYGAYTGLSTLGGYDFNFPQGRNVTQYQFVDDFTYSLNSKHTLKLGLNFHRFLIGDHDMDVFSSGLVIPFNLGDLYTAGADGANVFQQSFPVKLAQPIAIYGLGWYVQDEVRATPSLKLTFTLRMDHPSNPVCQDGCFARLAGSGDWASADHSATTPYNQSIVTGLNQAAPGFTRIVWQPRFGFAWTPPGLKNTVLRGGFGLFGDTFPGQIADQMSENPPIDNTFVVTGLLSQTPGIGNIFELAHNSNAAFVAGFNSGGTLASIHATDPAFAPPNLFTVAKVHVPLYEEWNFQIQQSISPRTSFTINYVGNHGYHESAVDAGLNTWCPNQAVYGNPAVALPSGAPQGNGICAAGTTFAGIPNAQLPGGLSTPYAGGSVPGSAVAGWDGRFGTVTQTLTAAVSNYNGVTVSVQHAFSHGLQMQGNFSWSHALDEISNGGFNPYNYNTATSLLYPTNPFNLRAMYGNADYDTRKYLSLNYVYEVPYWSAAKLATKGWQLSGTLFARSGQPFTVIDGGTSSAFSSFGYGTNFGDMFANYDGVAQPSQGKGCATASPPSATPCLNLTDFSSPTTGFSTQRRNQFFGPGYFDTDFTVMKFTNIPHWEQGKLGLGVQFFNLFNHPNFDQPERDIANPYFGSIVRTVNTPTSILGSFLGGDASVRLIQLTAKLNF
ncbi:MAG: TonB-dependent receptor [Terriglobales bacterium]